MSLPDRCGLACVTALAFAALLARADPVTIHLAGDSTMAEKTSDHRPETGWGEALQPHFAPAQVRVENHARNGRSTRTFLDEGLWDGLLGRVSAGDFVFIEFGHNDEVPSKVDRYTPPEQYRQNLTRFIVDVRAKRATPVLLTPVSRRKFDQNGNVVDSHRQYSDIVRQVAAEQHAALIDMDRRSAAALKRYGPEGSRTLFLQLEPGENSNYPNGVEDNTHFSPAGAAVMAALAVDGIRERVPGLAKYLRSPLEALRQADAGLLDSARLARLGAGERAAWQHYVAISDSIRRADRDSVDRERRAAGLAALTPAPAGQGFFVQDSMTAAWFGTPAAGELADFIVSYQAPNGGWSKRMEFTHRRRAGEAFTSADNTVWFSTIDNGATTEQLTFLAARIAAHDNQRYRASFERGAQYLLMAQFPNGCWPQVFPLAGSYHDAITFNDDATVNALRVLDDVATGRFAFAPAALRARAARAVQRGLRCMIATQVVVNGEKTIWGAQHDPLTLEPVKARAYEHASLSGREGAGVLDFLLQVEPAPEDVMEAVRVAAAWFQAHAIYGFSYAFRGDLTARPGAGPLWARFYELGSNRPIFSDRDGVVRYSLAEIGPERRYGYMWYTDEPVATLRRYERWARRHPESVSK